MKGFPVDFRRRHPWKNGAVALAVAAVGMGMTAAMAAEKSPGHGAAPAATAAATQPATQPADHLYAVSNTFKIPGDGGWNAWSAEPVTLDDQGKFLYVCRYHRTQVIDVATGKVVAVIHGDDPRIVALAPGTGRGFITENHNNTVTVFDLKTNQVLGKVPVGDNPHGIVYDPVSKHVLVACDNAVVPFPANIDLKNPKPDPSLEFEGSPGGIIADGQGMVYMTIVDKNQVAVIDTRVMQLATLWQIDDWLGPRGICLDREHSRLYLGCRARVIVLSAIDGRQLADVKVGTPDVWAGMGCVDFLDGKAIASCGEGNLAVIGRKGDAFAVEQRVAVPRNTWGMASDEKTGTLYLPAEDPKAPAERGNRTVVGIKLLVVQKKAR